jgi:hypothetical protein
MLTAIAACLEWFLRAASKRRHVSFSERFVVDAIRANARIAAGQNRQ